MDETFYLSNILPQNLENNSGYWNRYEGSYQYKYFVSILFDTAAFFSMSLLSFKPLLFRLLIIIFLLG